MFPYRCAKFQLIELALGVNVTSPMQQTQFGQQPQLQSISGDKTVFIKAIEVYTRDMVAVSPLTPSNPVASAADVQNAVISLNVAGTFEFLNVPLVTWVREFGTVSPSVYDLFKFRNLFEVDWTKSYVQIIQAPITTPPFSYLFGVHYDYCADADDLATGYQSIH
jgi:hypothetical protein